MAAKARWFSPALGEVTDDDPFASAPPAPAAIEDVGVPIAIGDSTAELDAELVEVMETVQLLESRGITCDIFERPDTTCHACPLAGGDRAPLCIAGRQLEKALTKLAVARLGR